MADGFSISGGFDDVDLENVFLGDAVADVLGRFAQQITGKLKDSVDKNKLNYSSELAQSLVVTPNSIIETPDFVFYELKIPRYGIYQNEGVNGVGAPADFKGRRKEVVRGSRFSFKENSKPPFGAMVKWANTKFGLQVPPGMTATQFGFAAAYGKKYFGIKPTFWIDDVLTDEVFEELQEELGKRVGFFINEQF